MNPQTHNGARHMSLVFPIPMEDSVWDEIAAGTLTTAAEGGIGYWADYETVRYKDGPHAGWVVAIKNFTDAETGEAFDDSVKMLRTQVNNNSLFGAFRKVIEGKVQVAPYIRKWVIQSIADGDAGMIDAEAADVLVQVAIFGDIVFG